MKWLHRTCGWLDTLGSGLLAGIGFVAVVAVTPPMAVSDNWLH
jgi:hypothetical protein